MLDHLRKQVTDALAQASQVSLTTGGIAGLQTSVLKCESSGLRLYTLMPQTSDHLVNIEHNPECVAVTDRWELRGTARRVALSEYPGLALAHAPDAKWGALIEIQPKRLQIARQAGISDATTIDIDETSFEGG
jgi:hypothetical protein